MISKRLIKKKADDQEDLDEWYRYYITLGCRINTSGINDPSIKEFFEKACTNLKAQRNKYYKRTRKHLFLAGAIDYAKLMGKIYG